MGQRLVIALGGNALGNTPAEQLELIKETARTIVDLVELGNDVIVTHGNGPQVGMIKVATDNSATKVGGTPSIPCPECGAMSPGYIGYHLQQAIDNELAVRSIDRHCASVVTQTEVNADDPAFSKPSKPVGAFFTEEEAKALMEETGNTYVEDAGRGWRWVVASPLPTRIVEIPVVKSLIDAGHIVVAVGGGGIPVVSTDEGLSGVPAVIDKDRSAALLAQEVNADLLVVLTAVDQVAINFNKPDQENLATMTLADCHRYIDEGQFAPGSMLPKVEACMGFVEGSAGKSALITSLKRAKEALAGETGTRILAE